VVLAKNNKANMFTFYSTVFNAPRWLVIHWPNLQNIVRQS